MAITFSSCSKDDNKDEPNGTIKLVKRIVESSYALESTSTFEYDNQNRLIKYIWDEDGMQGLSGESYTTTTIVYENNKMICTHTGKYGSNIETFYFNDAGYLTKTEYETSDRVDIETYTYNNGYLSRIDYGYGYFDTFTWQNGNITKIVSDEGTVETYEYTDIPNKFNTNLSCLFGFFGDVYWSVMKGAYSKNLPASRKSSTKGFTDTYTYTLDADGYPTKILRADGDSEYEMTITYY